MFRKPYSWESAGESDRVKPQRLDESDSSASEMTAVTSMSPDSIGPRSAFLRKVYEGLVDKAPVLAEAPFFASQQPEFDPKDETKNPDDNTGEGETNRSAINHSINRWWTYTEHVWDLDALERLIDQTFADSGFSRESYWKNVLEEVGPEKSVLSAWTNIKGGMPPFPSGGTDKGTDKEKEAALFSEWLKRHTGSESERRKED